MLTHCRAGQLAVVLFALRHDGGGWRDLRNIENRSMRIAEAGGKPYAKPSPRHRLRAGTLGRALLLRQDACTRQQADTENDEPLMTHRLWMLTANTSQRSTTFQSAARTEARAITGPALCRCCGELSAE